MDNNFIELTFVDDSRAIVNTQYIFLVSPTHGTDFANGADVTFIVFGEDGVVQQSVPAKEVTALLGSLNFGKKSQFIELTSIAGLKTILNKDYITRVSPTHGTNLKNGADISVWGALVQIAASEVPSLVKLLG